MKTRAAILWEVGADWSVEDIELDDPKAGEVKVKLAGSGLCHSDEHLVTGDMVLDPADRRGARASSSSRSSAATRAPAWSRRSAPGSRPSPPGDHVVLGFIPSCGRCPSLRRRPPAPVRPRRAPPRRPPGERLHVPPPRQGRQGPRRHVLHSARSRPTRSSTRPPASRSSRTSRSTRRRLVGCGVTTGWGSAVYAADVQSGETVVDHRHRRHRHERRAGRGHGRRPPRHRRRPRRVEAASAASNFGATHTAASLEEAAALVGELTWGAKADKAILTTGVATGDLIAPMMGMVAKGGRAVVTAVAPMLAERRAAQPVRPRHAAQGAGRLHLRQRQPRRDIPRLLRLYDGGQAQARRAGHQDLRPGGHQPGLPGHARRQEHPRHDPARSIGRTRDGGVGRPHRPRPARPAGWRWPTAPGARPGCSPTSRRRRGALVALELVLGWTPTDPSASGLDPRRLRCGAPVGRRRRPVPLRLALGAAGRAAEARRAGGVGVPGRPVVPHRGGVAAGCRRRRGRRRRRRAGRPCRCSTGADPSARAGPVVATDDAPPAPVAWAAPDATSTGPVGERVAGLVPTGARLRYQPGPMGTAVLDALGHRVRIDTTVVTDAVLGLDRRGLLLEAAAGAYVAGSADLATGGPTGGSTPTGWRSPTIRCAWPAGRRSWPSARRSRSTATARWWWPRRCGGGGSVGGCGWWRRRPPATARSTLVDRLFGAGHHPGPRRRRRS